MENILIIGDVGTGKTTKLKELLSEVSKNIRVVTHEKNEELKIDENDLLVIRDLSEYKNLAFTSNVTVYAVLQSPNIQHALQILKESNIGVHFHRIILLEKYGNGDRIETTRLIPIGKAVKIAKSE